jgi:hypothetical protein
MTAPGIEQYPELRHYQFAGDRGHRRSPLDGTLRALYVLSSKGTPRGDDYGEGW